MARVLRVAYVEVVSTNGIYVHTCNVLSSGTCTSTSAVPTHAKTYRYAPISKASYHVCMYNYVQYVQSLGDTRV